MTVFAQLESLPLAYLMVLSWVLCATVAGKLLGSALIDSTSGRVQRVLAKDVGLAVSADNLHSHVFERAFLDTLNTQILFHCVGDFARLSGGVFMQPVLVINHRAPQPLYPEKYWSGCPPNAC